jgi:thioredoxin-like negative regulator of GroEL
MKAEAAWRSVMAMMANWTGLTHRSMEDAAEANCEALVTRALGVAPEDVEVRLALASIRMSQSRADEARDVVLGLFNEMEGKEPCELA